MTTDNPRLEITWPTREDLPALVEIYNQAIRSGSATGHTEEFTTDQREGWYACHNRKHFPIYMMRYENKAIGYGTLSPYRDGRQAMRHIAEVSFFLDEHFRGKRFGGLLLQHMINDCPRLHLKTLIAILLDVNTPSIRLLERFGFQQWGHFPGVIALRDQTCGQLIYGKKLRREDLI